VHPRAAGKVGGGGLNDPSEPQHPEPPFNEQATRGKFFTSETHCPYSYSYNRNDDGDDEDEDEDEDEDDYHDYDCDNDYDDDTTTTPPQQHQHNYSGSQPATPPSHKHNTTSTGSRPAKPISQNSDIIGWPLLPCFNIDANIKHMQIWRLIKVQKSTAKYKHVQLKKPNDIWDRNTEFNHVQSRYHLYLQTKVHKRTQQYKQYNNVQFCFSKKKETPLHLQRTRYSAIQHDTTRYAAIHRSDVEGD